MAISLNLNNAGLRDHELEQTKFLVDAAYANLMGKNGAGKDFLGWLDLDETFETYCPGEFERLQAAAKSFRKPPTVRYSPLCL